MGYDYLVNIYKATPTSDIYLLWMSKNRYHVFHTRLIRDDDLFSVKGLLLKGKDEAGESTFNSFKVFNKKLKTVHYVPRLKYYFKHGPVPYPSVGYPGDKKKYVMDYELDTEELISNLMETPPYPIYTRPRYTPNIQIMSIRVGDGDVRFITDSDGELMVAPHDEPIERIPAEKYQYRVSAPVHEHIRAKLWLGTKEKYNKGFALSPFDWKNEKIPTKRVY